MAIKLQSTKGFGQAGVKLLVYGQAGAGKTTLIKTLPDPVIISAESGLLSLSGVDIPYITVTSLADLRDVMTWITSSEEAKRFKSIALDSISEIAEVVLAEEKTASKDGRAAYGNMGDKMRKIIRAFRDLPDRNVYFSAKMDKTQDDQGLIMYSPAMPGKTLTQDMPFFFDEVLALRIAKDKDGISQRALMCQSDGMWTAKDRSGKLSVWEGADLGAIISKINGGK